MRKAVTGHSVGKVMGARLRRLRKNSNLSQTEVAKLAGLTQSALSQIEGGKRVTSIDILWSIANALNVKLSTICVFAEEVMETSPRELRDKISQI